MLRFDPDSLSAVECDTVELIDQEPASPTGLPWAAEVTALQKLAAWASWGLFLTDLGVSPPSDGR